VINDGQNFGQRQSGHPDVVMTLRQEQLRVGAEWVAAGRVRVRRRVVSETRTVQVTLRREELVLDTDAAVAVHGATVGIMFDGPAVAAPTGPVEPLVIVLREERPEIVTRLYPYERVTVHVDLAATEQQIDSPVRTEAVDYAVQPLI
jgi:uncharacterized protein (TIGR02271 family)